MKKYDTYQVDAFTKEKFKGNPAGVVVNADGLTETEMLLIAKELNNRESAFLFDEKGEDYDGVIRYFSTRREVPLCGHATIAAMYAKATHENLDSCILRMKTQVGILPFEIIRKGDDYEIGMTQGTVKVSETLNETNTTQLLNAIGITQEDIDPKYPIQVSSTGNPLLMLCLNKRATLNNLQVNQEALQELAIALKCNGCMLFTFDSDIPEILTFSRMFAPVLSPNEDIVTGTAHGGLGAYLVHNNLLPVHNGIAEFKGMQGEALGRLGTVTVQIEKNTSRIIAKIKGTATIIFKTEIEL